MSLTGSRELQFGTAVAFEAGGRSSEFKKIQIAG